MAFITAAADEILGIVSQLHHPHPKRLEHGNKFQSIFYAAGVLPAEDDANSVLAFGLFYVGRRVYWQQDVCVLAKP